MFLYSAVVVASPRVDSQLPEWTRRINEQRPHWKGQPLHFTDLNERTKLWATRFIGKLPLRCFMCVSHKDNIKNYRNLAVEYAKAQRSYQDDGRPTLTLAPDKLWYSHFVLKVLLERATGWCETRSVMEYGSPRPVHITIAQRGGFYLDKFKEYLVDDDRVHWQNRSGRLKRYLAWSVVEPDLIDSAPADSSAGLQLADIVSGAFSRAIDERKFGHCDNRFAMNLAWRLARKGGDRQIADWSVTALPWNLWLADLSQRQAETYRQFGYTDEKLVRPGLILPGDG